MKDAQNGLEWKKLGDVADVNDRDHRTPTYLEIGIPLISPKDFTPYDIDFSKPKYVSEVEHENFIRKCKPSYGDILYSRIGTIGEARLILTNDKFVALHSIAVIKPNRELVNPNYLLFLLKTNLIKAQAKRGTKSIGTPDLGLKEIKHFQIPVPPLAVQKRIAFILERAEKLKERRERANAETERVVLSLFYKLIGNGFPIEELGKFVEKTETRDPTQEPDKEFIYIDISGVNNKIGAITETNKLKGRDAPSRARRVIKTGNVIVSTVRPNLNATALVQKEFDNQICSTGYCVLQTKKQLNYHYLYAFTRTREFISQLMSNAKGTSYPAVTNNDVLKAKMSIPPIELQNQFAEMVEKVEKIKEKQKKSTQDINQLFNALMQRAFTGVLTSD